MSVAIGVPQWRRWDSLHVNIFYTGCVLSAGLLPLYCFYYPKLAQKIQTVQCSEHQAEFVVIDIDGVECVVEVFHFKSAVTGEHLVVMEVDSIRYIACSKAAYQFSRVPDVPINFPRFCELNYESKFDKSAVHEEYCILSAQYGQNVMRIPESSFLDVAIRHILSPFYLFQYFAAGVWYAEDYWLYATLILLITFSAIYLTTKESIFNLQSLRMLAGSHNSVKMINCRYLDGDRAAPFDLEASPAAPHRVENVQDSHLVPGDKILIQEAMVLPCDAVLLAGKVVVDESMLTGESIPVSKVPIDTNSLGGTEATLLTTGSTIGAVKGTMEVDIGLSRSGSVLFGGTKVRACYGEQCIAVCYRTSFRSSKGQLVASLLKPKEGFVTFVTDALWVLLLMFVLATLLYIGVATELVRMGLGPGQVALHYLDAVTIAVPPALTACLTVATAIAISRLKAADIFVTDTSRVNFAGAISAACFDKTGTLTENTLQFLGAVCTSSILTAASSTDELRDIGVDNASSLPLVCQQVMATCHSLTVLGAGEGAASGDPLEVELLLACHWTLRTSSTVSGQLVAVPPATISTGPCIVLKHFEFTPDRLRAATLMKEQSGKLVYLLKGSPEVIQRMAEPSSVPGSINKELSNLARRGYRVIAMAFRECLESEEKVLSMSQDELEALGGIRFAGLLYLSSALKDDTTRTIQTLKHARIHTNMITGDHIHTAIAIGGQCKLVHDHDNDLRKGVDHVLYIIDEDEAGRLVVLDHATDHPVTITLPEVLSMAAQSLFRAVTKKSQRPSMFSAVEASRMPSHSTDTVDNPLFADPMAKAVDVKAAIPGSAPKQQLLIVELAITGKGLQALQRTQSQSVVNAVVRFSKIFARMKPYDKKYVVETLSTMKEFQVLNLDDHVRPVGETNWSPLTSFRRFLATYTSIGSGTQSAEDQQAVLDTIDNFEVLFCGDGANDMIALRAATVGVSLCDAETSVAAPITSKMQTPSAVIEVLKQGRCSLITAYVLILFNIMYGIIQLFMACELYAYGLKAGDYLYLIQDLFYTLVLGLAISYSEPSHSLSATLPPQRFLSPYFLMKLFLQLVTFIIFQAIALWALSTQHFYDRYETDDPLSTSYAYEASVADDMALAQLMIASIVSSIGEPFRLIWVKNIYHWMALTAQVIWLLVQIFVQDSYFLKHVLQLKPFPSSFGIILVCLMFANLVVSVALNALVDRLFLAKANQRWYEKLTAPMIKDAFQIPAAATSDGMSGSGGRASVDISIGDSPGRRHTDRKPLLK